MNEAQVLKRIEKIMDDEARSKADRARDLYDLGCERTDVVELLGMSYSQAHSIWKERRVRKTPASSGSTSVRADRSQRKAKGGSGIGVLDGTADADEVQPTFHLSPYQTRYITQDGHTIVRVDTNGGPRCRYCDARLDFSLQYLGFIHTNSTSEPTAIEDIYE